MKPNPILYRIAFTIARYVAIESYRESNDVTPLHRDDSAGETLQSLGGEGVGPPALRRPRGRRGAGGRAQGEP